MRNDIVLNRSLDLSTSYGVTNKINFVLIANNNSSSATCGSTGNATCGAVRSIAPDTQIVANTIFIQAASSIGEVPRPILLRDTGNVAVDNVLGRRIYLSGGGSDTVISIAYEGNIISSLGAPLGILPVFTNASATKTLALYQRTSSISIPEAGFGLAAQLEIDNLVLFAAPADLGSAPDPLQHSISIYGPVVADSVILYAHSQLRTFDQGVVTAPSISLHAEHGTIGSFDNPFVLSPGSDANASFNSVVINSNLTPPLISKALYIRGVSDVADLKHAYCRWQYGAHCCLKPIYHRTN